MSYSSSQSSRNRLRGEWHPMRNAVLCRMDGIGFATYDKICVTAVIQLSAKVGERRSAN